jgi:hypothetical protein
MYYDKDGNHEASEYFDGETGIIRQKTYYETIKTGDVTSSLPSRYDHYNKDGELTDYFTIKYDENGSEVGNGYYDALGNLTWTFKITSTDDSKIVERFDAEGNPSGKDVYLLDEDGNQTGQEEYNAAGVLILRVDYKTNTTETFYDDGTQMYKYVYVENEDGSWTVTEEDYNEDGSLSRRRVETYTEDSLLTDIEKSYPDETGAWINESYSVDEDGNETLHHTSKEYTDEDGVWIHEGYAVNEKGEQTLTELHKTYDNPDGSSKKEIYLPNDQGELVLTETKYYDEDGNEIKPVIISSGPIWYPSNTACTAGFSFRKLRPELTDKWYNFTPVDLSKDGVQTIPLVAGNVYIVGKVEVAVNGDAVTVSYSMPGSKHDTARTESEFFTFFANLDAVTTVNPEEIGEGFKFGEPVSIEKDLGGDTKVLLFVRNVLSFRDYYTADKKLARYWPNSKNYNSYYQYLESIMD